MSSSIADNINELKKALPKNVTLVCVSKTYPSEKILEAYSAPQFDFGENKVQEMVAKQEHLPKDIRWHLIGHLQRNKVKYIAPFVYLIHSVDSIKLLEEINKQAEKQNRTIKCLLQVHIANEESKFGFSPDELKNVNSNTIAEFKNIEICGLMGMATFTDNEMQIRSEFQQLKGLFEWLKTLSCFNINPSVLSMGMSGDYKIAIEEGSTHVRIGSAIFGARD